MFSLRSRGGHGRSFIFVYIKINNLYPANQHTKCQKQTSGFCVDWRDGCSLLDIEHH